MENLKMANEGAKLSGQDAAGELQKILLDAKLIVKNGKASATEVNGLANRLSALEGGMESGTGLLKVVQLYRKSLENTYKRWTGEKLFTNFSSSTRLFEAGMRKEFGADWFTDKPETQVDAPGDGRRADLGPLAGLNPFTVQIEDSDRFRFPLEGEYSFAPGHGGEWTAGVGASNSNLSFGVTPKIYGGKMFSPEGTWFPGVGLSLAHSKLPITGNTQLGYSFYKGLKPELGVGTGILSYSNSSAIADPRFLKHISVNNTTPAGMTIALAAPEISTVVNKTIGWAAIGANALYSLEKNIDRWVGGFLGSNRPKALSEDEAGYQFVENDPKMKEIIEEIKKAGGLEKLPLERLAQLAQYRNLDRGSAIAVRSAFSAKLFDSAQTLRPDQVEAYLNLPLAIPFSPLEKARAKSSLDASWLADTQGISIGQMTGVKELGYVDGLLRNFGVMEYSVGVPLIVDKVRALGFFGAVGEMFSGNILENVWNLFSPVRDRHEVERTQIQVRVDKAIGESERIMKTNMSERTPADQEKLFANLVYLRGYYQDRKLCGNVLGGKLETRIGKHLEKFGTDYAVATLSAGEQMANDPLWHSRPQEEAQAIISLCSESAAFLEGKRSSLGQPQIELLDRLKGRLGDSLAEDPQHPAYLAYYAATIAFLQPKGEGTLRAQAKDLVDGKDVDLKSLNENIAKAMVFQSVPLVRSLYAESLAPLKGDMEDYAGKLGKKMGKELSNGVEKAGFAQINAMAGKLRTIKALLPEALAGAEDACKDAFKDYEKIAGKVRDGKSISQKEKEFLLFFANELAPLGLVKLDQGKTKEMQAFFAGHADVFSAPG